MEEMSDSHNLIGKLIVANIHHSYKKLLLRANTCTCSNTAAWTQQFHEEYRCRRWTNHMLMTGSSLLLLLWNSRWATNTCFGWNESRPLTHFSHSLIWRGKKYFLALLANSESFDFVFIWTLLPNEIKSGLFPQRGLKEEEDEAPAEMYLTLDTCFLAAFWTFS